MESISETEKEFQNQMNRRQIGFSLNDYNNQIESTKLSLRKKKIDKKIMSKRIWNYDEENSIYEIKIDDTSLSSEIKDNFKHYIDTLNVKNIFPLIFSKDIKEIKSGLLILRNYIVSVVLKVREPKNRNLSRNNYDLINALCSFLLNSDKTIRFESSWCLINLLDFNENIEKLIYTHENMQKIHDFYYSSDLILYKNATNLISNACIDNLENQKFFIENNILYNLSKLLIDPNSDFSYKNMITRCISAISSIITKDRSYIKYFDNIIDNLKEAIFLLNKNPRENEMMILKIIDIFTNICQSLADNVIYKKFLDVKFIEEIENYFSSLGDFNFDYKSVVISFFEGLFQGNESETQILLNANVHMLLKNCIFKFQSNKCKPYLLKVIFCISNISSGTIDQIQELLDAGIYKDVMALAKMNLDLFSSGNENLEDLQIIHEIGFCISITINGTSLKNGYDICCYENWVIFDLIKFCLVKFNKNSHLMNLILNCLLKLFVINDDILTNENFVKENVIKMGIEDILKTDFFLNSNEAYQQLVCRILDELK